MYLNIPFLLLIFLSFLVWLTLYIRRFRWVRSNAVSLDDFSTRDKMEAMPEQLKVVSDNFQNLFELPVIFYALCLYLAWGNEVGNLEIYLAYAFVASRYVHSFIQCTYNKVMHRFLAYFIGAICLWVMVFRTIWGVLFF